MDDPPTIHKYSDHTGAAASSNLPAVLHSLVPPYFLALGPTCGRWYALASLIGFVCHVCFMAFVTVSLIHTGLNELIDSDTLPVQLAAIASATYQGLDWLVDTVDLPGWFVLSFIGWWFVSSIWMAFMYKRHHDDTSGWRAYIFGGGWAWGWWQRGGSGGDSDFDSD